MASSMAMEIWKFSGEDAKDAARIWNEVVEDGVAYPQEDCLSEEQARASTLLKVDHTGRVGEVMIAPKTEGVNNLCLDVYVVAKDLLIDLIREATAKGEFDFDRSVLQGKSDSLKIYGYSYDGFVEDIYTMQSYYQAWVNNDMAEGRI